MADKSFDSELGEYITATLATMISDGEMQWSRSQILNSDEAAKAVIARLPSKFRSIDSNHFRRVADILEKKPPESGGFPRFTNRKTAATEESLISKIDSWAANRTHEHSALYQSLELDSSRDEWKLSIKRMRGFQCAACGRVALGKDLDVHHYTYDRLGREHVDDVCCVCSPHTGRRCHALLDLARVAATSPELIDNGMFAGE